MGRGNISPAGIVKKAMEAKGAAHPRRGNSKYDAITSNWQERLKEGRKDGSQPIYIRMRCPLRCVFSKVARSTCHGPLVSTNQEVSTNPIQSEEKERKRKKEKIWKNGGI